MFLLYVNDLCNVSTRLTYYYMLFADDTSCFMEGTDLADMCSQLSTESLVPGLTLRQTYSLSMCQKQIA